MRFRTEIEPLRGLIPITHRDRIVMMGSCFTTEIGNTLARDGFDVVINPMGALYNPATIAAVIENALEGKVYTEADLVEQDGVYHCLDFPSTYQGSDAEVLLARINADMATTSQALQQATVWIITFGTAKVYRYRGEQIVGNCHKLPSGCFSTSMLTIDEIVQRWAPLCNGRRVIFTVSPIRHVADGLHTNQLSKATLMLAIYKLKNVEYFPAYEIVIDDLRDYRFYAADMKHPSDVAVEYIYEKFSETYFESATRDKASSCRKEWKRRAHRTIIE